MLDTQVIYTKHLHQVNSFFYEKINNLYNIYINNSIQHEVENIKNAQKIVLEKEMNILLLNNHLSKNLIFITSISYFVIILYVMYKNKDFGSEKIILILQILLSLINTKQELQVFT